MGLSFNGGNWVWAIIYSIGQGGVVGVLRDGDGVDVMSWQRTRCANQMCHNFTGIRN